MTNPELVSADLNSAIIRTDKNSTFGNRGLAGRNRKVSRKDIIRFLISMEGGSLNKELHRAGLGITASAFVQRRAQINTELLSDILDVFNERAANTQLYRGYRILAVDGTAVNMPRDPDAPSFVCNASAPAGYNQMHVTPLYDVLTKRFHSCVIQPQPKQDEIGALSYLLAAYDFDEPTLIVGDRGFSSYNLFATILEKPKTDFLIRVKQGQGAMKCLENLPMRELDRDVSFTITTTQTNADKAQGFIYIQTHRDKNRTYSANTRNGRWEHPSPYPMTLRVVRIRLNTGEYETLVTSLPRSCTAAQIRELYHSRWGIETAFRELKYTYGLTNIHGRSEEFVKQEIYASMIMANVCSRIVNEVVIQQRREAAHLYKVNQKMAVYLCREFLRTPGANGAKLMRDIAKYVEPVRPGRQDQRNLRAKSFEGFVYRVAA